MILDVITIQHECCRKWLLQDKLRHVKFFESLSKHGFTGQSQTSSPPTRAKGRTFIEQTQKQSTEIFVGYSLSHCLIWESLGVVIGSSSVLFSQIQVYLQELTLA